MLDFEPGCHRVAILAINPNDPHDRADVHDVDAELAWVSGEVASVNRTDSPDATLTACTGARQLAIVAFAGAAPRGTVLLLEGHTPLPDGVPEEWGRLARARIARALLDRRAPSPVTPPVYTSLGVAGVTVLPVEVEPGTVLPRRFGDRGRRGEARRTHGRDGLHSLDFPHRGTRRGRHRDILRGEEPSRQTRNRNPRRLARINRRPMAHGTHPPRGGRAVSSKVATVGIWFLVSCAPRHAAVLQGPFPVHSEALAEFVARDARIASAQGAGPFRLVSAGAGAPGDNLGGRIEAPADACVLFLTRGGPSIDDLDLFVYADDGTPLGADERPSATASVLVCPPHPKHLYAFARVASGHGVLATSAQLVAVANADRAASAVSAQGRLGEQPLPPGGWPGLDDALTAHRSGLGGSWHDVRRVAVPLEPRIATRISGVIESGQCLDFFAAPSDELAYTELVVLDAAGRLLGQAPTDQKNPATVVCSPEHAEVTFALRPHGGGGLAAIVMSVATDAKPPASGVFLYDAQADRSVEEGLANLATRLARKGYGAPRRVTFGHDAAGRDGMAKVARRESVEVDLPLGCSRLDVIGGAPLRGVESWLWSADGALVAHDDGASRSASFACGVAQRARLDVEAVTRAGPFAVQVRHLDTAEPALSAHPLAASRVLARMIGRDAEPPLANPGLIRSVALNPTSLAKQEVTVPLGQCLTVGVGLGPGAEGVELRLVNKDSNAELAFVRGTDSALTESCATNQPIRMDLELRVAAGSTDALLCLHARATATQSH